jgi:TetR/AcrR family transcriptional regulator
VPGALGTRPQPNQCAMMWPRIGFRGIGLYPSISSPERRIDFGWLLVAERDPPYGQTPAFWAKVIGSIRYVCMPTSNFAKRTEKRQQILHCAEQVFARRGVVQATMQDIARAAGVSKGALYLLFSSKEDLYLQVATRAARGLASCMQSAEGRGTGFERARALLSAYAQYHLEDAIRSRLALAWLAPGFHLDESIPTANAYRDVIVEVMRISVKAFEAGQADGSIRPDLDAPRTVLQLWGAVVGLLLLRDKAVDEGPLPPQVNVAVWSALGSQRATAGGIEVVQLVDEFVNLLMSAVRAA